ncbi:MULTISPECIES: DUF222 domain-containing protein, partial [unclassified Nocardioides]|uniref:DUF222 domain-containing protein n=1 Tax=unclassified Nocardioides TaxID=2615069 RepID=UPI0036060088
MAQNPLDTSAEEAAALVDAIRDLEDRKSRAAAEQADLTARLAALRPDDAAGLVAHARRESPARAVRYVGLAKALTTELPHTRAALAAGALSEWRATLIARETSCLTPEDRAVVDAAICAPDEEGGYPFEGWGDRRLVAETRALVATTDPAAVVDRRAKAEGDRHVSLRPAPDTMARLS